MALHAPRSGVDLEPNKGDAIGNATHLEELSNITLRRVAVSNVGGCGIEVKHAFAPDPASPTAVTILIDSCSVTGADRAGLAVAPVSPGAQGRIVITNLTVSDTACAGLMIDSKTVESARLELQSLVLLNTAFDCSPDLAPGYGTSPVSVGVNHHGGVGHTAWRQGELFGNVAFGAVAVGSLERPEPGTAPFLAVSQDLPVTGPGHTNATQPDIYRNITGTVAVYARQKQACDQLLGRTGARIAVGTTCHVQGLEEN